MCTHQPGPRTLYLSFIMRFDSVVGQRKDEKIRGGVNRRPSRFHNEIIKINKGSQWLWAVQWRKTCRKFNLVYSIKQLINLGILLGHFTASTLWNDWVTVAGKVKALGLQASFTLVTVIIQLETTSNKRNGHAPPKFPQTHFVFAVFWHHHWKHSLFKTLLKIRSVTFTTIYEHILLSAVTVKITV